MTAIVGQSSVAVSPFVSYVPSAATNPLAGFALTFGGTTGLALRGGADMSISNPKPVTDPAGAATGGYRPWSADADAMLFLGGLGGGATVFSRALSPYLFSGIGLLGGDSSGVNVTHSGWSYGAGATIPLGLDADLFGEARWRMSQYVLPTAKDAPDSKSELRFGLSFHVGGSEPEDRRRRRSRRMDDDDYDDRAPATPVIVVPQAPAPQPQTVVVTPAPQPQTVVVVPEPEPQPRVSINFPIIVRPHRYPRHEHEVVVVERGARRVVERVEAATRGVDRSQVTTTSCPSTSSTRRRSGRSAAVVCVVSPQQN